MGIMEKKMETTLYKGFRVLRCHCMQVLVFKVFRVECV